MNLEIKRAVSVAEVRRKIRLERTVTREIVSVLVDARRTFAREFEERGILSVLAEQQARLQETLANHYGRTQRAFANDVTNALAVTVPENAGPIIAASLAVWTARRSSRRAGLIMSTVRRRMATAVASATGVLSQDAAGPPSRSAVARTAANIVGPVMRRQAVTVAQFETQEAAENTKHVTAGALAGASPPGAELLAPVPLDQVIPIEKFWLTEQDDRVRPGHADAEGQRRPVDEAFIVNDQRLMFPGDTNGNATLDNVIGCRCTGLYERRTGS